MKKKRYTATCTTCGWSVERSKLESAAHLLAQHKGYEMCDSYLRAKAKLS